MRGILYEGGPNAFWVFLVVTIILGGAAALATGRAVARTWRPFAPVPFQMLILSGFVCFLHYALFNEPTIPLKPIGAALVRLSSEPLSGIADLIDALHYVLTTLVILTAIAFAGFRMTRSRQMERQYPWAMRRSGAFGWAAKADPGR